MKKVQSILSFNHLQRSCLSPLTHNISSSVTITSCNIIAPQLNLLTLEHGYKTVFISLWIFSARCTGARICWLETDRCVRNAFRWKTFWAPLKFWKTPRCLQVQTHINTLCVYPYCKKKTSFKVNHFNLYLANWIMGKWGLHLLTERDCTVSIFMNFRGSYKWIENEANCEGF